jgi:uncharacterized protein with ATP-grasp and redox domains
MKAALDCYPCFIRQALQSARFAGADEETQQRIVRLALEMLQNQPEPQSPVVMASAIHAMVCRETKNADPYQEVKVSGNAEALQWLPSLKETLQRVDDPLHFALKTAAVGNIMDYGAFAQFDISRLLSRLEKTDFTISERVDLESQLSNARTLTYFADNAGEIVFDRLLIEYLIDRFALERVFVVVRSVPFLNDVCEVEARSVGLGDLPAVEILNLPVSPKAHDPQKFAMAIDSDVIIAKGMANFESFSHRDDFYFLFIAKCDLVAGMLSQRSGKTISVGDWILHRSHKHSEMSF